MKRTLLTGAFAALLLGSTAALSAQQVTDVDRTKYPDYTDKVNPDWSLMTPARKQEAGGMKRTAATSQRPDHVNNANTRYFPPVFNQAGGSCGSASRICYMFSYELAAYRDLDASKPENYYPSHFVWLHTNSPSWPIDQGKDAFVTQVGVPSAATYGGQTYSSLFGYQEESYQDFGWMQGYDKWYEAMHNRMLKPSNFPVSVKTEEGREAVKNWLWNHNGDPDFQAGGICGIGVASGGQWYSIPKTETNDKIGVTGMGYVGEWGTSVDHALTVVGYDDRIEFDLDKDGIYGETNPDEVKNKNTGERIYTADIGEVGAWIIVNSWGGWQNGGFIYCPYAYAGPMFQNNGDPGKRTMLDNYWTPEIYRVRKDYRPLRTIKLEMDYSHRSEIALSAGISADVNATEPEKTISFVHFTYAGDGHYGNGISEDGYVAPEVPMLGRWADGKLHTEPMEFGYDLTDLTDGYDMNQPLKYFFIIDTKKLAKGSGTLHRASIIDYNHNKLGIETPFGIGESMEIKSAGTKTVISVVVQGGGFHAPQNASYNKGTLTWQAPLSTGGNISKYYIYADGKRIAEVPANTTQYTLKDNESAGIYGVSALYAVGSESSITDITAPVELSDPNAGIQFDKGGFTIPGVFTNKCEQATIEYWIKPTVFRAWNQTGGPGWGTFMFHFNADGTYTAGWDSKDADRGTTSKKLKEGEWAHVAIVVDKAKMSIYFNGVAQRNIVSSNYSGLSGFGDLEFLSSNDKNAAQEAVYDEIRIWKTARTAAQLKAYKDVEFTGNMMPQDLIAYLKGDLITDSEGNTLIRDYAGGHHATLHNANYAAVSTGMPALTTAAGAPTVSINKPTGTINAGIPVTLTANTNETTSYLEWTAEAAGIADLTVASPTITFTKAGTHTVTVKAISTDGQTATASTTIEVKEAPEPDATFTMTHQHGVPAGERVTLHASTPRIGYQYQWSMPGADITTSTAASTATSWQKQGTYKVTLTVTAPNGAKKSQSQNIEVVEVAPQANFSIAPAVVLKGETFKLNDESRYHPNKRRWHLNNGTDNYIVYADTLYASIDKPGVYDVKLTVSNNSGQSTMERERALIVTNADSKNGLVFGYDDAAVTAKSPFEKAEKAFTIDWWMNAQWPADETNGIGDSEETIYLKTMAGGKMLLYVNGKSAATTEGYIVPGEWHHYAVVFSSNKCWFYRDGIQTSVKNLVPISALPELTKFRIGGSQAPLKGSIDELRVWCKELTQEEIFGYANAPIADVAQAETDDMLTLYYNFNQSGGDVQDATSNANHGTRTGFGPDGDAWALSEGVFCLNNSMEVGGKDITEKHLKNYKRPFSHTSKSVNPSNSTRFYTITEWTIENTVTEYGITAGAHVDKSKNDCFTVTTGWDSFATKLTNHKAFQTITLEPGFYTFRTEYDETYEGQCGQSYLVAAEGKTLPNTEDLKNTIGHEAMKDKGTATANNLSFILTKKTTMSLGLLINMSGSQLMALQSFTLMESPVTIIGTTEEIPASIDLVTVDTAKPSTVAKGIYDLTGRLLRQDSNDTYGLAPGIYIIDGRKTVVK